MRIKNNCTGIKLAFEVVCPQERGWLCSQA